MSSPIISVENLGKCYLVGHQSAAREKYTALRDVLARSARDFARKTRNLLRGQQVIQGDEIEEFWALKNVSFEVGHGEVLGIIGRNGAGKSTLLKVLSRITEPTEGRVSIRGRVASLLEVGTGFHPELTGRENIFLNGAILGMKRQEIRAKFDEIVQFAEVERFLDTPVKRYSSGMYVRLAFAVAAHLEPEILVVDEVLAVGDLEFQKKCLGKMQDVAGHGRTVLFVSHNMDAVRRLCSRGILLRNASVAFNGDTGQAVEQMIKTNSAQSQQIDLKSIERTREVRGKARFTSVEMISHSTGTPWDLPFGEKLSFQVNFDVSEDLKHFEIGASIFSLSGTEITSNLSSHNRGLPSIKKGHYSCLIAYQSIQLLPGRYYLQISARSEINLEEFISKSCEFQVEPSDKSAEMRVDIMRGMFIPKCVFNLKQSL